MKNKSLLFVAMMLACFACSEDNDTQYSVSPELETYVTTFISEAQERGVTIPQNNLIAEVTSYKAQAIANAVTDKGQKFLYVHETIFKHSTATNKTTLLEFSIFNALGELFLRNKVEISNFTNIETEYQREEFFNQLIK